MGKKGSRQQFEGEEGGEEKEEEKNELCTVWIISL